MYASGGDRAIAKQVELLQVRAVSRHGQQLIISYTTIGCEVELLQVSTTLNQLSDTTFLHVNTTAPACTKVGQMLHTVEFECVNIPTNQHSIGKRRAGK